MFSDAVGKTGRASVTLDRPDTTELAAGGACARLDKRRTAMS